MFAMNEDMKRYKCTMFDCHYWGWITWIPSEPNTIPTCNCCGKLCEEIKNG